VIGYLGPEGTFTHQALLAMGETDEALAFPSVPLALNALRSGEISAAVVPIENSIEGGVSATLDSLGTPGLAVLQIRREIVIEVTFDLAVRPGTKLEDVRHIITHPHAAAQCRGWVAEHLPLATITERGSTAGAAQEVSNPDSEFDGAICAHVATELYGLVAAASNVADNETAVTRFVLVAPAGKAPERTGSDKTTLVAYMHQDRPGALLEILQQFAVRGVNLCRIESRPTKTTLGSYCFSIDAEGHIEDSRLAGAVKGLYRICQDVIYLGSYPRVDGQQSEIKYGSHDADYEAAFDWFESLRGN
jgi:prephenate dehydratase